MSNRCHSQKTIEGYNHLSEEFTINDVMKCFHQSLNAAKSKVKRLMKDGAIEKI